MLAPREWTDYDRAQGADLAVCIKPRRVQLCLLSITLLLLFFWKKKNLPITQGNEAFVLVVFNAFFFFSHNLTIMLCVILFVFILLDLFCLEYTESLKAMCWDISLILEILLAAAYPSFLPSLPIIHFEFQLHACCTFLHCSTCLTVLLTVFHCLFFPVCFTKSVSS